MSFKLMHEIPTSFISLCSTTTGVRFDSFVMLCSNLESGKTTLHRRVSGGQADPVAFRIFELGDDHTGSDLLGSPDPLASELLGLRQIARHVIHLHIDDQPRVAHPFLVL